MRLKNKKTGESYETTMPIVFNIKTRGGGEHTVSCESITELNEKWEDVPEEPKGIQWVDVLGANDGRVVIQYSNEEEAEKAVEKLKAWKRLKDFGCGFMLDDHFTVKFVGPDARKITSAEIQRSLSDDYKLLFGGEE